MVYFEVDFWDPSCPLSRNGQVQNRSCFWWHLLADTWFRKPSWAEAVLSLDQFNLDLSRVARPGRHSDSRHYHHLRTHSEGSEHCCEARQARRHLERVMRRSRVVEPRCPRAAVPTSSVFMDRFILGSSLVSRLGGHTLAYLMECRPGACHELQSLLPDAGCDGDGHLPLEERELVDLVS